MAYLVPLDAVLPSGEQAVYPAFRLKNQPGIPDDTYQLVEWYCPNPGCHCNEVNLEIIADHQHQLVARVKVPLKYALLPMVVPEEIIAPFAAEVIGVVTDYLQGQPEYMKLLREHYDMVKAIGAQPEHPAYPALKHWAETGEPPETRTTRKRHKKK